MRLYVYFTDSHKRMLDEYFLPSLIPGEYTLTIGQLPQRDPRGRFRTKGFNETMRERALLTAQAVRVAQQEGEEFFVQTDCDIQFFGRTVEILLNAIDGNDLVAESAKSWRGDGPRLSGGFFICRASDLMYDVWSQIAARVTATTNEQQLLNRKKIRRQFRCNTLDNRFWSPRRKWAPGQPLHVPDDIVMHHANWTLGVGNKMKMLAAVRAKVQKRKDDPARKD